MRSVKLTLAGAIGLCLAALLAAQTSDAAGGGPDPGLTTTTSTAPPSTISASVTTLVDGGSTGGGGSGGSAGVTTTVPRCYYVDSTSSQEAVDAANELLEQALISLVTNTDTTEVGVAVTYYLDDGVLHRFDSGTGTFQKKQYRVCPPGATVGRLPFHGVRASDGDRSRPEVVDEPVGVAAGRARLG